MSEAAQPEREERWDWKPGSGFKVCPVNSYNTLLPEPQAPSQHLPGPWVPFPRLSSLARKGTGGLISYHWASRHLQGSSCPSSAQPQHQAGGEKEWGGKKGETPAIGCPGMTSPGVRVGKQTSPPSQLHSLAWGWGATRQLCSLAWGETATISPCSWDLHSYTPLETEHPTSMSSWPSETSLAPLVPGAPKINFHSLSQLSHRLAI